MPQVMIHCPTTNREVYTGLNFDWTTFDWVPLEDMTLTCPACGEEHQWSKADAFLLSDGAG